MSRTTFPSHSPLQERFERDRMEKELRDKIERETREKVRKEVTLR